MQNLASEEGDEKLIITNYFHNIKNKDMLSIAIPTLNEEEHLKKLLE